MTLREIIYDVTEILNAYSDDHKISEEHIAFMVNNKRNLLLKQYMSNLKKEVPMEAMQTICLPLELNKDCFEDQAVMKSTIKVPSTLENSGRSNIVNAYAKELRFTKNINIIPYQRFPFVYSEKYNHNQLFITIDPESYLLVYNKDQLNLVMTNIVVEGVFENPEEAYNLSCDASNNNCDFYDSQYPIESSMIDIMRNQIVQELLLKYQIPTDNINNAEEGPRFENVQFRKR